MRLTRVKKRKLTMVKAVATASFLAAGALLVGGCDVKSFIDPSEVGRYNRTPLQKPILTSLSSVDRSIDDPTSDFLNAADATPEDLNVVAKDYVIGNNDLVNVSVSDLVGPGVETTKTTRVSESGNISLPLIGQVHADGLTEAQLEQAIIDAYNNANLIQHAQVSVTVAEARARTFSALGAVATPGQYAIVQSDFRLLDALVLIKDVSQGVDYVYVVRQVSEDPQNQIKSGAKAMPAASSQPSGGGDTLAPRAQSPTGTPGAAPEGMTPATPFSFNAPKPPAETRVIKIPIDPLKNGDFRYNVVIRPRDMILVPNPAFGEYYMGGHVSRTGVYSLSNRKITLKMAVISAGMLDGVAIPQRCDVIRRVGTDREVFARVNLDGIFAGTEPDLYLKPNDQVMIGTNFLAPFIAGVRTGFRFSYGAGFLYDRNFAPDNNNGL